jgi:UTP--glucose-1-phosphate uridylyltransferase
MTDPGLTAAEDKMRSDGQSEQAIRSFRSAYERLRAGESGTIRTADLEPAQDVPALEELPAPDSADTLRRFAMIKLNGGLATSMGLQQPKSLLEAREGQSFLDVIAGQTLALRRRFGIDLPLVLMDSEATRSPTLEALAKHRELAVDELPADFLQSMIPKLDADTLAPVTWAKQPTLEWCPPGHGDVYSSLKGSGLLDELLTRGFHYAMISNSDNTGATLDPRIADHIAAHELPFVMEVVEGTEAERKGGHIARRKADGQLILRETAQTPKEDEESFRDYRHWRYYNTNNLWVDLRALDDTLNRSGGVLELPLIVNRKTVDPRDSSSTPVLQLESAMGAAIGSFTGASLLCVPRTRFVPVKTTDDLLVLRSDVYRLSDEMLVEPQAPLPYVELDSKYYKLLDEFERRFPDGAPSLREAERFVVHGDVTFRAGVVVKGVVEIDATQAREIADTVLT